MTSDDIRRRQWTEEEREAVRRIAEAQRAGDDSHINYDDIPPLTEEQLAKMVRLRDVRRKVAVSVRCMARASTVARDQSWIAFGGRDPSG